MIANEEHLEILKEGVEVWNAWRVENPEVRPVLWGNLSGFDLSGANLSGAIIIANLGHANLRDAKLIDAHLGEVKLTSANLIGAKLRRANLSLAKLTNADLSGADLSSAKLTSAEFRSADLSRVNLRFADLCNAKLIDADLNSADLTGADLRGAVLRCASLIYADLGGNVLSSVDLSGAVLRSANLSGAYLSGVDLREADLRQARIGAARLSELDLRKTEGLEDCNHTAYSTIGTDTLAMSKGQIPETFLKGCGLQDWEIVAAKLHDPELTSKQIIDLTYEIARIKAESPIQVNPIFISYSHEDGSFIDALEPQLDNKRVRYWRDVHDATAGPLEEIVDRAMRINSIVLLVLSKNSVESDWVEWEVRKARKLAKERKEHVLCPIALDDSWKSCRWPGRLRVQVEEYNILNFSCWQDESAMAAAFQKLIDGLGLFYKPPHRS